MYLDAETRMNFQVYRIQLGWGDPAAPDIREAFRLLDLLVDMDSGRVLSFSLQWSPGSALNWGLRGASGFGGAWRDYWGMDSVSTGWYTESLRGMLEETGGPAGQSGGDYTALDQVSYLYDGQSLPVYLGFQSIWTRGYTLIWNR